MTSRLRTKLDQLEQSGRNLNESFCQIGTPLPPLSDTKKDQGEFVPIWKQEVRDEQGRRRLHGAFTGGFSAGYFNTVGSKEGWTPSTFKSSRNARAQKTQRAEDFMDDEDLEEMRQSRKLENTDTFKTDGGFGGTAEELAGRGGSSVPSAISSLIQPASSSIGQKLLVKLGWRPGQGIGPRVSARKRRIQERKLQSGGTTAISFQVDDADDLDDAEASKHTYAPRDTKLPVYDGKQGKEGLGYIGGQTEKLPSRAGPGGQADVGISAGFGLGIDDADEDDLDIYHGSSNINDQSHTRLSFDLGLDGDGEDVVMLGSGASQLKSSASSSRYGRPALLKETDKVNRWHDGRPVLAGFTLDSHPVTQDKWFDFPAIPPHWRPRPSRVWNRGNRWDKRGDEQAVAPPTGMGLGRRPQLTADQRGAQLGEEQIKAPLKSIFDYMSEKSKERLALFAASKQEVPPSTGLEASKPDPASLTGVEIPHLSPRTASAALMGFIPFGDDPAKQQRYRSYLVSQTHNTTSPNPELLPSKSIDHINKELQDFSKSATIFKPMSFAMANRFTSSKVSAHDMKQPEAGLHMPDPDRVDTWKDKAQQEAEIQEILTPKQEAARSGMYGNLTRTVESFYPNKLLCKRFGVADPYPDGPPGKAPGPTAGSSSDIAAISATPADLAWTEKYTHKGTEVAEQTEASSAAPPTRRPRTLAEVGMADDDNQGGDILTYKKPSIDIFRAIFQDDDSEEDDDDDDNDNEDPLESTASASLMLSRPAIPLINVPPITPLASEPLEGQNDRLQSEAHRPIFQIRTKADTTADEESSRDREATKAKGKAKKKREKTQTSTKILMSFDVGDEGEDDTAWTAAPKRKRERDTDQSRSGKKHREDPIVPVPVAVGDEEDEWVEKDVLGPLAPPPGATSASTSIGQSGRKKASDFM